MSKLKVDEIRSADRSVSSTANITLADNGNVGIGATNPSPGLGGSDVTLEIAGATSPSLTINDTGQAEKYSLYADSNDFKIGYGTTILTTFQNDGKVGIGTTTPESILTLPAPLYTSSDTGGMIRWQNQDTDHASDVCIQGYNVDGHGCEMYIGLNSYVNTGGSLTKFNSSEEMCGILLGRTGDYGFYSAGTSGSVAARLQIDANGKLYSLPTYNNTTSSSPNVAISSSGEFLRDTSSRQYKTNIVDSAKGLNELLTLRPVDFTSLCNADDPNKLKTGLIAEEVAEAGFEEYTVRDENQEIQSVEYGHMVSLCIKAIQELSDKVTALENK